MRKTTAVLVFLAGITPALAQQPDPMAKAKQYVATSADLLISAGQIMAANDAHNQAELAALESRLKYVLDNWVPKETGSAATKAP